MLTLDSASGLAAVEVKGDVQELHLSSAVVRQLADHTLEVKSGRLSLQIPADLLRQLQNQLPEQQREDSVISLKMTSPGSKGNAAVAAAAGTLGADIALKGRSMASACPLPHRQAQSERSPRSILRSR